VLGLRVLARGRGWYRPLGGRLKCLRKKAVGGCSRVFIGKRDITLVAKAGRGPIVGCWGLFLLTQVPANLRSGTANTPAPGSRRPRAKSRGSEAVPPAPEAVGRCCLECVHTNSVCAKPPILLRSIGQLHPARVQSAHGTLAQLLQTLGLVWCFCISTFRHLSMNATRHPPAYARSISRSSARAGAGSAPEDSFLHATSWRIPPMRLSVQALNRPFREHECTCAHSIMRRRGRP
jgi:hypothetical protein